MDRIITVTKKTGFKNKAPNIPIRIRDIRGIMFYNTEFIPNPVKWFNLPVGKYIVESGSFTPTKKPRKYKYHKTPLVQRYFHPDPFGFKVEFGNNPHKCSILWKEKRIIFDKQFLEKPLYIVNFILFHEFGHHLYKSEKGADAYAGNMMKARGYNPSQIGLAPLLSLSKGQFKRKLKMVDNLTT